MHAADVKSVLRVFSLEVPAREKDDLKEEPIVVKLRKVSSVSYLCPPMSLLSSSRPAVPVMTVSNRFSNCYVSLCISLLVLWIIWISYRPESQKETMIVIKGKRVSSGEFDADITLLSKSSVPACSA